MDEEKREEKIGRSGSSSYGKTGKRRIKSNDQAQERAIQSIAKSGSPYANSVARALRTSVELERDAKSSIQSGDLDKLKDLAERGVSFRGVDQYDIGYAIEKGRLDILKFLAEQEFDFKRIDWYVIKKAIKQDRLDILKFLAKQEVDFNILNEDDIKKAINQGRLDILKFLAEQGVNFDIVGKYVVYYAINTDRLDILEFLAEQEFNFKRIDKHVVHHAINYGRLNILKFLADREVDFKSITYYGMQDAIKEDIRTGSLDILKLLAKQKVDFNILDQVGIREAIETDRLDILKFLVEHGFDLYRDPIQDFVVHYAIIYGRLNILKFLADRKVNFKGISYYGIGYAIENGIKTGRSDILDFLAKQGVDVSILQDFVRKAIRVQNVKMLRFLYRYGVEMPEPYKSKFDKEIVTATWAQATSDKYIGLKPRGNKPEYGVLAGLGRAQMANVLGHLYKNTRV